MFVQIAEATKVGASTLAFGCGPNARLMIGKDENLQRAAVELALQNGITWFDTAPAYGEGVSEQNLGRALKGISDGVQISTKVLIPESAVNNIEGTIRASIEASCDRLGRGHLDAVFLHNRASWRRHEGSIVGIGPLLSIDDVLGAGGVADTFDQLKASGRIGVAGFTAFGGEQSAIDLLLRSGRFEEVSALYGLGNPTAGLAMQIPGEEDYRSVIDRAVASNVRVTVFGALHGGVLSEETLANAYSPSIIRAALRECDSILESAIRFSISIRGLSKLIVGISEPGHVTSALDAVGRGPLSFEVLSEICWHLSSRRCGGTV